MLCGKKTQEKRKPTCKTDGSEEEWKKRLYLNVL
jgi:hypothetical protein